MGTRQHKTKGWVIFAVFCAVLFCVAALRACAAKAAPEGCSLKRIRPAQTACFPLGTTAWRGSGAHGWGTHPPPSLLNISQPPRQAEKSYAGFFF